MKGNPRRRPEGHKQMTILNRVLRWDPGQIVVEADPSHAKRIVDGLQADSKGLEAPAVPESAPTPGEGARSCRQLRPLGSGRWRPPSGPRPCGEGRMPRHVAPDGFERG